MGKYNDYVFSFFETDSKKTQENTQRLIKKMAEFMADSDFGELEQLLNDCKVMRYPAQGYLEESQISDEEKLMLANVGYTMAIIDAMQLYREKVHMQYEIQKINTKYRDLLLRILAERGTLLHKDLAIALGVSVSGLSAIVKQMNATSVKLINVETVSKYKLYSITAVALRYINKCVVPKNPREENVNLNRTMHTYLNDEYGYKEVRCDIYKGKEYVIENEIQIKIGKNPNKFNKNNLICFEERKIRLA